MATPIPKKTQESDDLLYQLFQNAAIMSRSMLANRLGTQFDGERDLYKTFGYPYAPGYQDYKNLYDRQGMAARLVEKFANDTWNSPPTIIDGESRSDQKDGQTKFIKEWNALTKRLRVYNVMRQADIMLGFSRYSVIFFGVPGEFHEPIKSAPSLSYLKAFDEQQATIGELINDQRSEKFAMPGTYNINFNSIDIGLNVEISGPVDASRVIHIVEDSLGSNTYGRPRLQTVINRLFDLEKVTGGGAEGAWLSVVKGVLLSAREGAEVPAPNSPEARYIDEQMNNLINRIQRYAMLTDVDVNDLGFQEVRIKDLYETLMTDISGSKGIPQRILMGSERGNQASTQDTEEWEGVIKSRRTTFAEPVVLRPFINLCIALGILTAPSSGEYDIEWKRVYGMNPTEEAAYANSLAAGASSITGGVPEDALDVNEWRSLVHLSPRDVQTINQGNDKLPADQNQPDPNNPNAAADGPQEKKGPKGVTPKENPFSANVLIRALNKLAHLNSFEGHAGRPGEIGGSLPRGDGGGRDFAKIGLDKTFASGGVTIKANGTAFEPKTGYVVAQHPERGQVVLNAAGKSRKELKGIIKSYVKKNVDMLAQDDLFLGLWLNKDNGGLYLDCSSVIQNKESAIKLGMEADQIAIWDIVNVSEISTGGSGLKGTEVIQ